MSRRLSPPSGMAPPTQALLGEQAIALEPIARRICDRYRELYPDEEERYGEAGMAWCRHDNQHILNWAIGAEAGLVDLDREVRWLAGVLAARSFPMDRYVRNLELAAEELEPQSAGAARRLRGVAAEVGT